MCMRRQACTLVKRPTFSANGVVHGESARLCLHKNVFLGVRALLCIRAERAALRTAASRRHTHEALQGTMVHQPHERVVAWLAPVDGDCTEIRRAGIIRLRAQIVQQLRHDLKFKAPGCHSSKSESTLVNRHALSVAAWSGHDQLCAPCGAAAAACRNGARRGQRLAKGPQRLFAIIVKGVSQALCGCARHLRQSPMSAGGRARKASGGACATDPCRKGREMRLL